MIDLRHPRRRLLQLVEAIGPRLFHRRAAPPQPSTEVRRLLFVRWQRFGDLITLLPAVERVRALFPQARVTWMVRPAYARFLDEAGIVDEVWSPNLATALLRRQARFDLAIEFHQYWLSLPLLVARRHARRLVGYNAVGGRWLLDIAPAFSETEPVVTQHLRLVEAAAGLRRTAAPAPQRSQPQLVCAQAWRQAAQWLPGRRPARFLILQPGCGTSSKRWPTESWQTLAQACSDRGWTLVLTGHRSERNLCAQIAAAVTPGRAVYNDAGKTTWGSLAALVAAAAAIVAPDTGIVHLAQALGTPSVALFGPVNPRLWGYDGAQQRSLVHRLPCSFCDRHTCRRVARGEISPCLRAISPADVLHALEQVLAVYRLSSSAVTASPARSALRNAAAGSNRLATR